MAGPPPYDVVLPQLNSKILTLSTSTVDHVTDAASFAACIAELHSISLLLQNAVTYYGQCPYEVDCLVVRTIGLCHGINSFVQSEAAKGVGGADTTAAAPALAEYQAVESSIKAANIASTHPDTLYTKDVPVAQN